MSRTVTRLFRQFQPEHYQITLAPDAKTMTFTGQVTIRGRKVGRPSQRLTLHQKDLKITTAQLTHHDRKGDHVIELDRINQHGAYDELRLHSSNTVYPGNYTIELTFEGQISQQMNGLYPCFFEQNGKSQKLLATQFESHHAREVLPCIDEPEAKATFDLSITAPKDQTVLANTPLAKQATANGLTTHHFETTPKMSIYLLAFVIGNIGYKEAKTKAGTLVRAYATPDNVPFTEFALDVAVKCLDFYNDYFGLDYPLPKADLIALPDFASGAMENWGCITFREQCMLVDPNNTSLPTKQYVAMVVAHELAHQWFGNLVTMRWWTDLWLNEGFASWIEYLAVDHLFPDWQMWTQFIADEQQAALRLDALEHTHPIEVPVRHPDEIRTIFDTISYSKGASVIHMLHEYLGAEAFRAGLRTYLKKHQYGNTDTIDLWDALAKSSGKPVRHFMHTWTSQPGFPLVKVNQDAASIELSQQRFYANPKQKQTNSINWPVACSANGVIGDSLLSKATKSWRSQNNNTIKLNRGQSGFYRTLYSQAELKKLGQQILDNDMSPLDRLGLLADTVEGAKAGYTNTLDALQLLTCFKNEDNSAVWDVMASALGSVRTVMDSDELRQAMKPFTRQLVAKQLARLGWQAKKTESHFDSLLRPTILSMASLADEPSVVKESLARFNSMKKPEDLPPELRGLIYVAAARHGDEQTFDRLLALHNASSLSEERTTLAAAITSFEQPNLIKRSLDVIDTKDVRLQDVAYWVAYSFMNRHAKKLTWQWLTEHWAWLDKNLGSDLSFSRFPLYAARSFSDDSFAKQYRTFFEPRLSPTLERSYQQGLETLSWQSAWRQRDLKDILEFFKTAA